MLDQAAAEVVDEPAHTIRSNRTLGRQNTSIRLMTLFHQFRQIRPRLSPGCGISGYRSQHSHMKLNPTCHIRTVGHNITGRTVTAVNRRIIRPRCEKTDFIPTGHLRVAHITAHTSLCQSQGLKYMFCHIFFVTHTRDLFHHCANDVIIDGGIFINGTRRAI